MKIIIFLVTKFYTPTPLNRSFLPNEQEVLKYFNIWYFI